MSVQRIWALILRYLYTSTDATRITEFLFWPMIDIGFFGLIAKWSSTVVEAPHLVRAFVTGLVLWQIIYRSNYEVCVNLMDEITERNLTNLVSSPLRKNEWVMGMMGTGLLKIIFSLFYGAFVGWLFFRVNVFSVGWILVPFVFLCLLSGWIIGFTGAAILVYKGTRLQQLPWVIIMLAAVFSAVFYPLEVLHPLLKTIAQSLPMSYIFQGMRALISTGIIPTKYWLGSTVLSVVYLALAIKFFLYMFEKSRTRGLNRLT